MHRYENLFRRVQEWIEAGVVKPGDRLPSIRQMSAQSGFSPMTVQHSYGMLESAGLIRSSARSGYYVTDSVRRLAAFSRTEIIADSPTEPSAVSSSLQELFDLWRRHRILSFGSLQICRDLLPSRELTPYFTRAIREDTRDPLRVANADSAHYLREVVLRRSSMSAALPSANHVVLTMNGQVALDLGLWITAQPGDAVLVEAPTSFQTTSAIHRRGLRAIEVYSHPVTGLDPDQFDYLISRNKVKACLLSACHHTPTGVSYSDDVMRRIVDIASRHKVTILEDVSGVDLHFEKRRPNTLKSFDDDDTVIEYGDFSNTLGQRYGVGWISSSRYSAALHERQYHIVEPLSDTASAVARYIQNNSFERHIRRTRATLETRMRRGLTFIARSFPSTCSLSKPSGGYLCWIRMPPHRDSLALARAGVAEGISVLPGPLFSVAGSFRNFVALNLSCPWDAARQGQIEWLGRYIAQPEGRER